jgi:ABC-type multidrug transport system permease subunit
MVSRRSLVELTLARIREFLREPEAIFWVFVFPVLLSIVLGIAFRERGRESVRVGIQSGPGAEEILKALERDDSIRGEVLDAEEAEARMRNGEVVLLIVPGAPPTYRFDPSRTESRLARLVVDRAIESAAGREDRVGSREEIVSGIGNRYIDFLIPGLLGLNLMGSGMYGIGFAVVQMRAKKLLKRFVATPMRRSDFLLSLMLSRMVFLLPEMIAVVGAGSLLFGVPVRGSLLLLAFVSFLGAVTFSGLGTLCATRARTVEAISGLLNFVMMPMWLASGVFFSTKNFPDAVQPLIQALPLTALNDALRMVMLDGEGLAAVAPELLLLVVWGLVPFALALRIFRWT